MKVNGGGRGSWFIVVWWLPLRRWRERIVGRTCEYLWDFFFLLIIVICALLAPRWAKDFITREMPGAAKHSSQWQWQWRQGKNNDGILSLYRIRGGPEAASSVRQQQNFISFTFHESYLAFLSASSSFSSFLFIFLCWHTSRVCRHWVGWRRVDSSCPRAHSFIQWFLHNSKRNLSSQPTTLTEDDDSLSITSPLRL